MKRLYLLALFLAIIPVLVISAQAQEESEIPSWIKGVAVFWIDGGINDVEFIEALEFMIDNNIIKLGDNVIIENTMSSLTVEERDFFELTIEQKQDRIKILENEITNIGLDNSKMLVSITELQENNDSLQTSLTKVITEFDTYKKDYPLKVGNIGGELVNVDTIINLENQIQNYKQIIEGLEAEIRQLKDQ